MPCTRCGRASGHPTSAVWRCPRAVEYLVKHTTGRDRMVDVEANDLETTFVRCVLDLGSETSKDKVLRNNGWTLNKTVSARIAKKTDKKSRHQREYIENISYSLRFGYPKVASSWEKCSNPQPISPPPKKQRRKNQTTTTCVVCLEKGGEAVAVACGHASYCWGCAQQLSSCAVCRKTSAFVQLYF